MSYQSQLSQLIGIKKSFFSQPDNDIYPSINSNSLNIPIYEMTLEFSNNIFQTFLLEIEERNHISIKTLSTGIILNFPYKKNTLKIAYKSQIFFIIFQNKQDFIENVENNTLLFEYIYELTKITEPTNIILLLYMVNFNDMKQNNKYKSSFIYFLSTKLKIKIVDISNSDELVDYIYNFNNSILTKDNKSKITFFDTKPVQTTSLTQNENIKNITFIKHLMCLPGISERIAIAIVKNYPRIDMLYDIYLTDEYNEKEKENLLENIQIVWPNGTKRLGPAMSNKIYKFFMADNPESKINN